MAGPCGGGWPTMPTHKDAKCRDRERCQGPGCRVRRPVREDHLLAAIKADSAAREAEAEG